MDKEIGPGGAVNSGPEDDARLTPEERRKLDAREAETRYNGLLAVAADFIDVFQTDRHVDSALLDQLQEDTFGYFFDISGPYLFENLQLARYNKPYYHYHLVNVALLNALIGKRLNKNWDWLKQLVRVGLLSDLGMLQMPSRITDGKDALTDGDRVRIRQHPQGAIRMMREAGIDDEPTVNAVLHHHERFNGSGYPSGLAGEDIPLESRITAVADSFDAALSRRAYRDLKSPFAVLAEFAADQSGGLDPNIITEAVDLIANLLTGRHVMLSDHSIGQVMYVDPDNLAYPEVRVLGRVLQTDEKVYPISLTAHMSLR